MKACCSVEGWLLLSWCVPEVLRCTLSNGWGTDDRSSVFWPTCGCSFARCVLMEVFEFLCKCFGMGEQMWDSEEDAGSVVIVQVPVKYSFSQMTSHFRRIRQSNTQLQWVCFLLKCFFFLSMILITVFAGWKTEGACICVMWCFITKIGQGKCFSSKGQNNLFLVLRV